MGKSDQKGSLKDSVQALLTCLSGSRPTTSFEDSSSSSFNQPMVRSCNHGRERIAAGVVVFRNRG